MHLQRHPGLQLARHGLGHQHPCARVFQEKRHGHQRVDVNEGLYIRRAPLIMPQMHFLHAPIADDFIGIIQLGRMQFALVITSRIADQYAMVGEEGNGDDGLMADHFAGNCDINLAVNHLRIERLCGVCINGKFYLSGIVEDVIEHIGKEIMQ